MNGSSSNMSHQGLDMLPVILTCNACNRRVANSSASDILATMCVSSCYHVFCKGCSASIQGRAKPASCPACNAVPVRFARMPTFALLAIVPMLGMLHRVFQFQLEQEGHTLTNAMQQISRLEREASYAKERASTFRNVVEAHKNEINIVEISIKAREESNRLELRSLEDQLKKELVHREEQQRLLRREKENQRELFSNRHMDFETESFLGPSFQLLGEEGCFPKTAAFGVAPLQRKDREQTKWNASEQHSLQPHLRRAPPPFVGASNYPPLPFSEAPSQQCARSPSLIGGVHGYGKAPPVSHQQLSSDAFRRPCPSLISGIYPIAASPEPARGRNEGGPHASYAGPSLLLVSDASPRPERLAAPGLPQAHTSRPFPDANPIPGMRASPCFSQGRSSHHSQPPCRTDGRSCGSFSSGGGRIFSNQPSRSKVHTSFNIGPPTLSPISKRSGEVRRDEMPRFSMDGPSRSSTPRASSEHLAMEHVIKRGALHLASDAPHNKRSVRAPLPTNKTGLMEKVSKWLNTNC